MKKIDLGYILKNNYPHIYNRYPALVKKYFLFILEKILHIKEINKFLLLHNDKQGFNFIDELFEYLDFAYSISNKDREKIPSEGRLICIANHPLGGLDGLALLKAIGEIRSDVKIVANRILFQIENLNDLFLPYNILSNKPQRENLISIGNALENEQAVIIFPAAEVSRLNWFKVKESDWHKGALFFAKKYQAPVLPVYVDAKNSAKFYFISMLKKNLATLLLPGELFKMKHKTISLKIGDQIPAKAFNSTYIRDKAQMRLLKKHLYLIGREKKGIFITERNIIFPVNRKVLKKELSTSHLLGSTNDGKKILLTNYLEAPNVIKEVARLRELTFRKVGEGTGSKMDIDDFDKYYKHLILWDEDELEIVGSYRIALCKDVLSEYGVQGLYTSTLFNYTDEFINKYLTDSIELGRSFIQKKYWNSSALDYLWQGIGAFLAFNQSTKYMFGAVSISNAYPDEAKKMMVYFYNKWFGDNTFLVKAKNRFIVAQQHESEFFKIFNSENYKDDYKKLKFMLKHFGYSVPPLYKHYSDLCIEGGVRFLDFGVDEGFENCVDGLILVEIDHIKEVKKERYILNHLELKTF